VGAGVSIGEGDLVRLHLFVAEAHRDLPRVLLVERRVVANQPRGSGRGEIPRHDVEQAADIQGNLLRCKCKSPMASSNG